MAATAARRSERSTGARRLERHARPAAILRLGARDALLHGAFADQEGAGDLLDRQARDDAQRQRDLLRRRQVGMAADEQQPQDVVAVVGAVEPLGERRLGVLEVGEQLLVGQRLLLRPAAHGVDARRCGRRRSARRSDRAAGRSAARSSAPAGRRPGRPPRPCRDRGNSAAARATAWGRAADQRRVDPGDVGHVGQRPGMEQCRSAGSRRSRPGIGAASSRAMSSGLVERRRSRRRRSRAAAPWSRRRGRRSPAARPCPCAASSRPWSAAAGPPGRACRPSA